MKTTASLCRTHACANNPSIIALKSTGSGVQVNFTQSLDTLPNLITQAWRKVFQALSDPLFSVNLTERCSFIKSETVYGHCQDAMDTNMTQSKSEANQNFLQPQIKKQISAFKSKLQDFSYSWWLGLCSRCTKTVEQSSVRS